MLTYDEATDNNERLLCISASVPPMPFSGASRALNDSEGGGRWGSLADLNSRNLSTWERDKATTDARLLIGHDWVYGAGWLSPCQFLVWAGM